MSVTKTALLNLSGSAEAEGGQYTLTYLVRTDDTDDGPRIAMSAVGWDYLDAYSIGNDSDPTAWVTSINAEQLDDANPLDWTVTVEFGQPEEPEQTSNPLTDPVEEVWTFGSRSEDIALDLNNQQIINTAGDFLAVQRNNNQPTVTFTRNEATINQALIIANRDSVNKTSWRGFPPRTVKVANITNSREFHTQLGYYWKTSYAFEINTDTWRFRPLNAGLREKKAGRLQPIYVHGEPVTEVVPLKTDGSSARNSAGVLTANPYLLNYQLYPEVEFNALFVF